MALLKVADVHDLSSMQDAHALALSCQVLSSCAFPDAITARGLKHLRELSVRVSKGDRAVLSFLANRPHGSFVRACHERDPEYAKALRAAQRAGVESLAYRTRIEPAMVTVGERIPVRLG